MSKIIWGDEHFGFKKWTCGVYKIVINDSWFYIGSSIDLKRRLSGWKHILSGKSRKKYIKNRSIAYVLPTAEKINFEIIEFITDGSDPKIREDFFIKENFENEFCLNLIPSGTSMKGRKLPLGVIRREKKILGPPTPKKPVAVFDRLGNLIMKCESIAAATQKTGIKEDTIRKIFAGKPIIPREYIFKPVLPDGTIGEIVYATKFTPAIIKFIFDNFLKLGTAELSRQTGIRPHIINDLVRGRTKKIKGILPNGVVAPPKPVIKMDLNGNEIETYPSINSAAKSVGAKTGSVQDVLYGRGRYQVKGYKFKFA